jgi:anthranilate synthase component 1
VRYFERLPMPERDVLGVPESVLMFTDTLLVFDHVRHTIKVVSHARLDGDIDASYGQATWRIEQLVEKLREPLAALPEPAEGGARAGGAIETNMPKSAYLAMVERAKEYIVAGDVIQVVMSQRFSRPVAAHPFNVYRSLLGSESVAVHVLPGPRRVPDRRRLARDAGARGRGPGERAPDRRDPGAGS